MAIPTEFRIHAHLKHPRIVEALPYPFIANVTEQRVERSSEEDMNAFAMRLYPGGDLQRALAKHPGEHTMYLWATQLLSAVDYLIKVNVSHGDPKPSNFVIDGNGDLAITDFGWAKNFTGEFPEEAANSTLGSIEKWMNVLANWFHPLRKKYNASYGPYSTTYYSNANAPFKNGLKRGPHYGTLAERLTAIGALTTFNGLLHAMRGGGDGDLDEEVMASNLKAYLDFGVGTFESRR